MTYGYLPVKEKYSRRLAKWLFWTIAYALRNRWRPETSAQYGLRTTRCWKPRKKADE
jgi:hypothetical protein